MDLRRMVHEPGNHRMKRAAPASYDLDDPPIESRSYDYFSVVQEYNDAWKRIRSPATTKTIYKGQRSSPPRPDRGITQSEIVLQEAKKLYGPDDMVSPMILAEHLGLSRQTVSSAIKYLRKRSKWPFQRCPPGWVYRRSINERDNETIE